MTNTDISRYVSGLVPIIVIPPLFLIVPRLPAHLRAPTFGSVIFLYGSWTFMRRNTDTGGGH
jgi:hypothetical protein